MYVTKLKWCGFVIWSPLQDPFVQRVCYDPVFMEEAVSKAQKFYFEQFLPSVVPCMIVPLATGSTSPINSPSLSVTKESPLVNRSPLNIASFLVDCSAPKRTSLEQSTLNSMVKPSLPLKHNEVQHIELQSSKCNLVHISPSHAASGNQHTDIPSDVQIIAAAITTSLPIHNVL